MNFQTVARYALSSGLTALLLVSCAGQRPPEGGPLDTEPPIVVSTIPPNYTTQFKGSSITVEFNEYVDHRTVEGAVFVSPSVGSLEYDWSGREVEIRFPEPLRRSTTYVVTIGTDVADLRNRNKMVRTHTLAFSTGEEIDHGAIEGRVYPRRESDSPLGVMVFAYNLRGINPDTLNPAITKPDYVTQTGKDGEFSLLHLSWGVYRIFAVRDEYKNLLYDPESDDYAVASTDMTITPADTLWSDVWLKLAREDTTAPRLVKITPTTHRRLLAEFSSPLDTSRINPAWFQIADTLTSKGLSVFSVYPIFPLMKNVVVVTDSQSTQSTYRLRVDSLSGANGLRLNPTANTLLFNGAEVRDSLPPSINTISVRDTAKDVDLSLAIRVEFSTAMQKKGVEQSITLADSARKSVPLSIRWLSDASAELVPTAKLAGNTWYVLRIAMRQTTDLFGRNGRDSLRTFRFRTTDDELFSSIEGIVSDSNTVDTKGGYVVTARNVAKREQGEYQSLPGQNGVVVLRSITEGRYIVVAFRDRNGNKRYDPGTPYPYQPSERFVQYPDTLKVRARWPLEGVELRLR